jgi:hypothetical protein
LDLDLLWPWSSFAGCTGTDCSLYPLRDTYRQSSTFRDAHPPAQTKSNPFPDTHIPADGKGTSYPQPGS